MERKGNSQRRRKLFVRADENDGGVTKTTKGNEMGPFDRNEDKSEIRNSELPTDS